MSTDLSEIRARLVSEWCTGLTAAWCPIHGDCVCDREEGMDNHLCPLHAVDSDHATVPPVDTPAIRAERAEAAIERVRAMHRPIDAVTVIVLGGKKVTEKRCIYCHDAFPCPTLRALGGAS